MTRPAARSGRSFPLASLPLRPKVLLILSLVMALYVGADFAIQRMTVTPGFLALEEEEAKKDAARVVEALQKEVSNLHHDCLSWSSWDDMALWVETREAAFAASSFDATRLRNGGIDLLFVCDTDGQVLLSRIVDPDTGEAVRLRDFPTGRLSPSHPFLARDAAGAPREPHGLLRTEHAPMLASARPILRSDGSGEPRGTVILGRFLRSGLEKEIREQTKVASFDLWQLDGTPLEAEAEAIRDELTTAVRPIVRQRDDQWLHAYVTVNDFQKRPDFLVRAHVARDISRSGAVAVRYALLSTVSAAMILLLVLLGVLQSTVLSPLLRLTRHAVEIGKNEDFRAKLDLQRDDEVGILSREFDKMMENLEHARAALVDTARMAGKSEIATGILHNVGNVLNSVNISATLVSEKARELSVDDLQQLSDVLAEHANDLAAFVRDDPRGAHVQPFLAALVGQIGEQRSALLAEMTSLSQGIEHIRELVKSQQSFAVKVDLQEETSIPELIDRAIALTNEAEAVDPSLEIVKEYDAIPDQLIDRHKLLEILVNLIQNARQAMDAAEGPKKRLTIGVRDAEGRLRISVADTGIGIPGENLLRIFHMGFTTKPGGHGFGLHGAANAATQMGGRLVAESDGPGKGATFVLDLPLRAARTAGAAR